MREALPIIFNIVALITTTSSNLLNKQEPNDLYQRMPNYEFEMVDLLGLGERPQRSIHLPSLRNSASRFLLEVYDELTDVDDTDVLQRRHKRSIEQHDEANFITSFDRVEIEKCNNIITFASKSAHMQTNQAAAAIDENDSVIRFNIKDTPLDLQLVHAALRVYQNPGIFDEMHLSQQDVSIIIYQRVKQRQPTEFRIVTSLNSTSTYKGWLEFNATRLLANWLTRRYASHELKIMVHFIKQYQVNVSQVSLTNAPIELQPFIVGYFNGPDLMDKVQRLRFKRDVQQRKRRRAAYYMHQPPPLPDIYHTPKTCERLNFTLDFKDLQMHNWVIAPKKFEAYFCGGECNFPLNSRMNATNHAIVQTLMHLKQPNLPKPCCVPTALGSISILHYLNEDSVNLSKYPQSVAKECGCH